MKFCDSNTLGNAFQLPDLNDALKAASIPHHVRQAITAARYAITLSTGDKAVPNHEAYGGDWILYDNDKILATLSDTDFKRCYTLFDAPANHLEAIARAASALLASIRTSHPGKTFGDAYLIQLDEALKARDDA